MYVNSRLPRLERGSSRSVTGHLDRARKGSVTGMSPVVETFARQIDWARMMFTPRAAAAKRRHGAGSGLKLRPNINGHRIGVSGLVQRRARQICQTVL